MPTYAIRLPEEALELLRQEAMRRDMPVSRLIRQALADFLGNELAHRVMGEPATVALHG